MPRSCESLPSWLSPKRLPPRPLVVYTISRRDGTPCGLVKSVGTNAECWPQAIPRTALAEFARGNMLPSNGLAMRLPRNISCPSFNFP